MLSRCSDTRKKTKHIFSEGIWCLGLDLKFLVWRFDLTVFFCCCFHFLKHVLCERNLSCNGNQIWALQSKVWLHDQRSNVSCLSCQSFMFFCCDLIDRYVEVAVEMQSVRCHVSHWTALYSTNYLALIGIFPEDHIFASCWSSSDSSAVCPPFILLWC